MSDDRNEAIRARAYRIWQDEGEPAGRDEAHWAQAERELAEARDAAAPLVATTADSQSGTGKPTD